MYPESSLHDANAPALTKAPMQPYTHSPGPQDHNPYPGYWAAPAWTAEPWPPSPRQTPPHIYARHEVERAQPPPPMGYSTPPLAPPPPHTSIAHPHYDRIPQPTPWQAVDRRMSLSPRSQQLQVQAAQAVLIDPRAPIHGRHPQGPLPTLAPLSRHPTPPRGSHSPPRTASSTSSQPRKASLSSILLHPTPTNSEPNSANPANSSSAGSSPRALAAAAHELSTDVRALRSLDRKFF
ncbi:hypothetical protein RRF57_005907 [Xylaria bambusicola]|uniref:Uncharacterized protein n=1 Tax=Xylaria bambusicola TaxID=326684 RepID=A0AAN7UKF0_9PEZI